METKQTRKDTIEVKFRYAIRDGNDRTCYVIAEILNGEWKRLEMKEGHNRFLAIGADPDTFAQDLAQALDDLREKVSELDN